jgi:7,8-dihydropterin-6-yl-methyl-4-(beta-D-ribofuranosyl)aminobenzene 5'-phosphate synthase
VPEVDRAAIRVVTDNYHFALSPSGKIGDVLVERIVFPLSDKPPGKVLLSEFGLSMHLETQRGSETRNVLIDFGYSSHTLLNNLNILSIDPAKLDALVLSHGHYDHFGGMVGFLAATQGQRKPKLPLYIGGEECSVHANSLPPDQRRSISAHLIARRSRRRTCPSLPLKNRCLLPTMPSSLVTSNERHSNGCCHQRG